MQIPSADDFQYCGEAELRSWYRERTMLKARVAVYAAGSLALAGWAGQSLHEGSHNTWIGAGLSLAAGLCALGHMNSYKQLDGSLKTYELYQEADLDG